MMDITDDEIIKLLGGCKKENYDGEEYIACPVCGATDWADVLDIVHKDDCWLALKFPHIMKRTWHYPEEGSDM